VTAIDLPHSGYARSRVWNIRAPTVEAATDPHSPLSWGADDPPLHRPARDLLSWTYRGTLMPLSTLRFARMIFVTTL
jgi:hypothetical protein